jgi:Protein of unknown function (DUF3300)
LISIDRPEKMRSEYLLLPQWIASGCVPITCKEFQMNVTLGKKILSAALCVPLVVITTPIDAPAAMAQSQPAATTTDYSGQGAPLTAADLQGLVAPIALYPDALVAQILSAATFPDQIAVADNWVQTNTSLKGSALSQAVDKQTWDPSVKALTEFPSVLHQMAQSLAWTSSLGEAYHNQQADVMTAVQTLRAQAQKAGNLKSGAQITVVQQSPQTIVIQPTNPQIVYVPEYNPTIVYGTPYVTPGYSTGALVATGLLSFGAGMAIGAMMSGGYGWGYSSWNCNWHGGAVYYHGGAYYGNSAWHGGYYGGGYNNAYHNNYNNAYHNTNYNNNAYHNNNYNHNSYNSGNRTSNVSGNTVNVNRAGTGGSSFSGDKSGSWGDSASSHGWGQSASGKGSTAFSGFSGGGSGGWQSRSSSARGWGSRGGGGGWGGGSSGGGFRGGGGRR